jgi:hypothetical protein
MTFVLTELIFRVVSCIVCPEIRHRESALVNCEFLQEEHGKFDAFTATECSENLLG